MDKAVTKIWIYIVALSGCLLSGILFHSLQSAKSQHIKSIVAATTSHYKIILDKHLRSLLVELDIAQGLYQDSQIIDPITFSQLVNRDNHKPNGLLAIEWIPRISRQNLQTHQKSATAQGKINYTVNELTQHGEFEPVRPRSHYYPIYFAAPEKLNSSVLGYDIGSDPEQLSALMQAMSTNNSVSTAPLTLMQTNTPYDGFVIFKPVYENKKPIDSSENRTRYLKGFVAGAFSISGLINDAFNFIESPNETIQLIDITEPRSFKADNLYRLQQPNILTERVPIRIIDRDWSLQIEFRSSKFSSSIMAQPETAVLISLLITALAVYLTYKNYNTTLHDKQSLYAKTFDLQTLEQLQRVVFSNVSDAIIMVSDKAQILSVNPALEEIFGYSENELVGQNINILVASEHSKKHDHYITQYKRTGKSSIVGNKRHLLGRHKLGHEIPIRLMVSEIKTRTQLKFNVVIRDLSTQVKTHDNNSRVLEAIRLSPDLIVSFNYTRQIVYKNDAACGVLENTMLNNFLPSAAQNFLRQAKKLPNTRHSWAGESSIIIDQGNETLFSLLILSHACCNNSPLYFTAIFREITMETHDHERLPAQRWG